MLICSFRKWWRQVLIWLRGFWMDLRWLFGCGTWRSLVQKDQTGQCYPQRSDLEPDTCDTSAGTSAALKTTTSQVFFFPYLVIGSALDLNFTSPAAKIKLLIHLHWSGHSEECYCCHSLQWEKTLQVGCPVCGWNLKLFQTTNTHPVLLGLPNQQHASLEAAHVYEIHKILFINHLKW